jgi:hypothetical protein
MSTPDQPSRAAPTAPPTIAFRSFDPERVDAEVRASDDATLIELLKEKAQECRKRGEDLFASILSAHIDKLLAPSAPRPTEPADDDGVEDFLRAFYLADEADGLEGWDDFSPENQERLRGHARRALAALRSQLGEARRAETFTREQLVEVAARAIWNYRIAKNEAGRPWEGLPENGVVALSAFEPTKDQYRMHAHAAILGEVLTPTAAVSESAPPETPRPTEPASGGPARFIMRQVGPLRRLVAMIEKIPLRQQRTDIDFENAYHEALESLAALDELARQISPTWSGAIRDEVRAASADEVAALRWSLMAQLGEARRDADALRAELAFASEALDNFGVHDSDCESHKLGEECSCGIDAAADRLFAAHGAARAARAEEGRQP